MTADKNTIENTIRHETPVSAILRGKTVGNLDSQLFRLIEYDDGVPFQLLFGALPGDGQYIFSGKGLKKLTGFDPDKITEKYFIDNAENVTDVTEGKPADISELRSLIMNGRISFYRIEMHVKTASGEKRWIRETAIPFKDEETGKITGLVGILNDVTCARRNNEPDDRDEESEKLKNSFLQNISHEVRTPLNAIVGFSSLICEPEETYTKKEEIVNLINNSTDHLLHIMDSIIEISSIEAGTAQLSPSKVQLHSIMTRIYNASVKKAGEKRITLKYVYPEKGPDFFMKTDEYKLHQSVNNLVNNAIKFTPPEGRVEFGFAINGNNVDFYISDTGIGIDERHKQRIFDKFYQAESSITRRYQGVGLGLSISKAYIEMLGGKIRLQSSPDSGSTFRFTLPSEV